MRITQCWTRMTVSAAVLALGIAVLLPGYAAAQEGQAADTTKKEAAMKAMEAAADSARKAAEQVAARAKAAETAPDPAQKVSDSAAAAGAAKAAGETAVDSAKVLEAVGDAAGKSVADTTAKAASEVKPADTKPAEAAARPVEAKPEEPVDPTAPYKNVTFAKGEKPRIVMETSMGNMVIELWPDVAPKHCQSFVYLINKGFYDSLTFHRIVPGFVIQGGDPQGTGMGGPGYMVPGEFSTTLKHEEGMLSMARSQDPNSAGSQFFICLANTPHLDGKYTIFGKVVEGLEVIHKIEKTPAQRERPVTPVHMTKVYMQPKS